MEQFATFPHLWAKDPKHKIAENVNMGVHTQQALFVLWLRNGELIEV